MFKLLSLKLNNHKAFQDPSEITFNFVNAGEEKNGPYFSIIIGPNGTGKSNILRIIIDIFREIESFQKLKSKEKHTRLIKTGHYEIKYLFKNKEYYLTSNPKSANEEANLQYAFDIGSEYELPEAIIASSIMLNDKFPSIKNHNSSIYHYMGIRKDATTAGTTTFIKNIVSIVIDSFENAGFKEDIVKILEFLGLKEYLGISFIIRSKYIFQHRALTVEIFHKYFQDKFKKRTKSVPYSKSVYEKLSNENIEDLVNFINKISKKILGNRIEYDFLTDIELKNDYSQIKTLMSLDLLTSPIIKVKKTGTFDLQQSSSGEFHFIALVLGILAKIKENSLIILDEPELSLHPNWQMKYIHFFKNIFKDYKSCQFVIATHSHYLVSDLEGEMSSITSLKREGDELKVSSFEENTYGWSAEEVLLKVFDAHTTRNYYVANKVGEILKTINENKNNKEEISKKINELLDLQLKLNKIDPLFELIENLKRKFLV